MKDCQVRVLLDTKT